MRLKLREFRFRTGPHEHRVVQPWQPLRHTSLRDPAPYGVLTGDHDGLNRLAGRAYPPYAHFRRPGESASRPRWPAAVL